MYLNITNDGEKLLAFKRKLNKTHQIGYGYTVERIDGISYRGASSEIITTYEFPDAAVRVAEWVHYDREAAEHAASHLERSKLKTLARKSVSTELKRAYRRTSYLGKRDIWIALIDELENG